MVFREFDDLTLARWLAQTLGQLGGKTWRLSHPLLGAYRLAAQIGHERQIWFKRLATPPSAFLESQCCRAPMLPLLTRDVRETGLICQHCSDTLVPFEEIPEAIRGELDHWALQYAPVHAVAHWDDRQRKSAGNYDRALSKPPRKRKRCSPAPAVNSRRNCWIFTPPSSGKTRMNAWRSVPRMSSFKILDLRFKIRIWKRGEQWERSQ